MSHKFSRAELYQLVWSEPLRKISKKLGVSDVAIGKRCRAAGISLPGPGYWARKEAGKKVLQPELPQRRLGQSDFVILGREDRYGSSETDEELLRTDLAPPSPFTESLAEVTTRAKRLVGKIGAVSLAKLHPLIDQLLQEDEKRREKQRSSPWSSIFNSPLFDTPFERRRLRLLNALFLTLSRCGGKPWRRGREANELGARIGDHYLTFILGSVSARPQHQYPPSPTPAKEKMKLEISWYEPPPGINLRWQDQDTMLLEDQLEDIAVGLLVAAEWGHRLGVQRHYEYRVERKRELQERIQRQAKEAARKERERAEKLEAERLRKLIAEAVAWRQATDIRQYVRAQVERRKPTAEGATLATLEAWANWAFQEADRLDPLHKDGLGGLAGTG